MQKLPALRALPTVLLGGLILLTACDRPDSAEVPSEPQLASIATASLLSCPSDQPASGSGLVSRLGGAVSTGGNTVLVPAGTLLGSLHIEMTVPASQWMLVEFEVNGHDHWQFTTPVTVTIDYSRCNLGLFDPPVTVWHVDPATGEMLEPMGGLDVRLLQRVTFVTDHFSGYAIAN